MGTSLCRRHLMETTHKDPEREKLYEPIGAKYTAYQGTLNAYNKFTEQWTCTKWPELSVVSPHVLLFVIGAKGPNL